MNYDITNQEHTDKTVNQPVAVGIEKNAKRPSVFCISDLKFKGANAYAIQQTMKEGTGHYVANDQRIVFAFEADNDLFVPGITTEQLLICLSDRENKLNPDSELTTGLNNLLKFF